MAEREAEGLMRPPSEIGHDLWKTRLRWAVALAVVVVLVAVSIRAIDFREVARALAASDWRLVALAGLVAVTVCMFACSVRLYVLTKPLPARRPIGFWHLTSIYYASNAAHHLLPAPAAEVLRTVQLKRRHGYSIAALVAAQVVERVIDALALSLEILLVALIGDLPRALHGALLVFAGLTAAGVVFVIILAVRHKPDEVLPADAGALRGFLHRLTEGVYLLRAPRIWLVSLGCSFVNDLANVATVGLVLTAVGLQVPVASWFVVVLVARLAGLLPSTPGQFGVIEAGIVLALVALGVNRNEALAAAVLYHLAHFVPITLVGLWELRKQWQAVES
jgi:uncharacterized membrane protein YbhN (UPF0104 family)